MPINTEYGFHTHLLPVSFTKKKKEEQKWEKRKKKVMSRDNITEFPLWKLVPPERGVAKCDTDHDQGFVLITISVFLT